MQLTPAERGFRFFKQSFVENPWKELEKRAEWQLRNLREEADRDEAGEQRAAEVEEIGKEAKEDSEDEAAGKPL